VATLPKGTHVVKVECRAGCTCDGAQIPPGTFGVIADDEVQYRLRNDGGARERYYRVEWAMNPERRVTWWTYAHGIRSLGTMDLPDSIYLEGL